MRVAIVGPTGVLGRNLVPLLLHEGHSVRALAHSPEKAKVLFGEAVEIVACDLLAEDLEEYLPGMLAGCQAVMHIATAIPDDFSAPGAWETNNQLRTEGTRRLLDASLQTGVRRYVQESICMAYPDSGDEWISENVPLDTSPDRAVICDAVIRMEEMLHAISLDKLEWCILRCGMFVGPGTFQERTSANILNGAQKVPCDGSNFISPVHVKDVARAFAAALVRPVAGATLNVNAEPLRQGEYYDLLAKLVGGPPPERDLEEPCPASFRCSNHAAKALLAWEPVYGLYSGVS